MQVLKEKMRKNILKAAKAEFLKHGYDGSDMRRIAKRANCSPGNPYRYFKGGKEEMFNAVVGTGTLSMDLWERDTKAFCMLVEKKLTKVQAVDLILENLGVVNLIEVIEGK